MKELNESKFKTANTQTPQAGVSIPKAAIKGGISQNARKEQANE